MVSSYVDLTEEQQKMLDDAALSIVTIKRDTQSKLAASGAAFDDGGFGSKCDICGCTSFMGDALKCANDSCRHSCSDHVFT